MFNKFKNEFSLLGLLLFILLFGYWVDDYSNDMRSSKYIYNFFTNNSPDSNIVVIAIKYSDRKELSWPIKRSYYALLFDELKKYSPKVIGFEILLSDKLASQEIYNDLLVSKIKGMDNIVFSSVMENFEKDGEYYNADSVEYPAIKKLLPEITTGHLNYIADDELVIPHIFTNGKTEYPFSLVLAEKFSDKILRNISIRPQLLYDLDDFQNYTFIEFLNKSQSGEIPLSKIKDKIVIVGFDGYWNYETFVNYNGKFESGLILNANAIDNLLNNRLGPPGSVKTISGILYISFLVLGYLFLSPHRLIVTFSLFMILLAIPVQLEFNILLPISTATFLNLISTYIIRDKRVQLRKNWESIQKEREENGTSLSYILQTEKSSAPVKPPATVPMPVVKLDTIVNNFEGIIYSGEKMLRVINLLKKSAPEKVPVLILGESGSGKELVARAIHNLSDRHNGNFVAVNCAALSDTLLESELFGHVAGAFTGAVKDKMGRFELANNGTIFLDEIGETSDNFQSKLLRVIQSGEYEKVGSSVKLFSNARIVAATNKDLKKQIAGNKFREDLYYRLNVISINLPSLRERKEDIPPLAKYFLHENAPGFTMNDVFLKHLILLEWKGNVRQLQSAIKRAAIFAKFEGRNYLAISDLPDEIAVSDRENIDEQILALLREKEFSHTSIKETAKELGDLNRNLVTENFKGMFFSAYVESGFDITKASASLSSDQRDEVIQKVESKGMIYIKNVEDEVMSLLPADFYTIKEKLSVKYKNLPKKFHYALDIIVKRIISGV